MIRRTPELTEDVWVVTCLTVTYARYFSDSEGKVEWVFNNVKSKDWYSVLD